MRVVIDSDNPKLRIFGLINVEHFERNHMKKYPQDGVAYIKPHPKGDIVTHILFDEGIIYAKMHQSGEKSKEIRAQFESGGGDLILHEIER